MLFSVKVPLSFLACHHSGQGKGQPIAPLDAFWTRIRTAPWDLGPHDAFSEAFVGPLAHLLCLQEFQLRVTIPLGPGCRVLRNICVKPLVPRFDKPDGDDSYRSSKIMGEWQASLWPLLTPFQLKFKK